MSFSKDFIFSSATASYQVEGAWNVDGKGENIWDHLTHTRPELVKNRENGDVACDFYHHYPEDIKLMKELGFQMFRMSISWTRIMPTGDITSINTAGIDFYHKVIDELLKNGIQPMVTIYHWDLPKKLQDMGGWLNPLIVDYIEDFADVVFKNFGDKVKWWITINEPPMIVRSYEWTDEAPGLHLDSPANYIVAHNILRAHGRIYRLYEQKYRATQNGKLSLSLFACGFFPKTDSEEDAMAAERANLFELGWYSDPIYSDEGDYPKVMRETIDRNSKEEGRNRSRLPSFTAEEINSIRGSFDFFGLNHYISLLCSPGQQAAPGPLWGITTFTRDRYVQYDVDPAWPRGSIEWMRVVPHGLTEQLLWIKNRYHNVPVFITENGYCDYGALNDEERISYYRVYLQELEKAIKEHGCNVIGHTAWSFLDNFEWLQGYDGRFGLVEVDFKDPQRKRTPKSSAKFFQELIKTRTIPK